MFQYVRAWLFRRKRIKLDAHAMLATLDASFGVTLNRLIVAQAQVNHHAKLITRARLIRQNYLNAIW